MRKRSSRFSCTGLMDSLARAIEEALGRIRAGTFGVCEACKGTISKARLEGVPWTRHCRGGNGYPGVAFGE